MISVVFIVKNEQIDLPEAIKSAAFADEIIVVDDNSTDETPRLAKELGAKVFTRKLDDFSSQRNFGAEQASNEWILALDADERISEDLKNSILKSVPTDDYDGFWIGRRDVIFGRPMYHGEVGNIKLVRLYRKSKMHFTRPVHEILTGSNLVGNVDGELTHFSHRDVGELFDKINRYSSLDAKGYFDNGVREPISRLISYPLGKFVINYFAKMGFLDGFPGLVLAVAMSTHSFLVRSKLHLLWNGKK